VPPASLRQPRAKHGSPHQASLWISGVVAISGLLVGAFALMSWSARASPTTPKQASAHHDPGERVLLTA
jgi:hypothetical protein